MRSRRGGNIFLIGLRQLLLIAFSMLALYPIYYMVVTAFKTREDWLHNQFGFPNPITLPELYGCPEPRQYPALVREQRRRDACQHCPHHVCLGPGGLFDCPFSVWRAAVCISIP